MAETKAELEQRIAELTAENEDLKRTAEEGLSLTETNRKRQRPERPTDKDGNPQLSEGERQALESAGVVVSPFNGETLNALTEGVEPGNPQARRAAEREHQKHAQEVTDPNAWPAAGPPPAEGGDTDPLHDQN